MAEEVEEKKPSKVKAFFQNKIVRIVSYVLIALGVVALILGGTTAEGISSFISLIAGVVSAVGLVVTAICTAVKTS